MRLIRPLFLKAGCLSVSLLFSACGQDAVSPIQNSDPLRDRVVAMGFQRDMIRDVGNSFVVEGDIVISKTSLLPNSVARRPGEPHIQVPGGPQLQFSTYQLLSPSYRLITVDVSGANLAWQSAIRAALNDWNYLTPGSTLQFVEGSFANVRFSMDGSLGNAVAAADFPSGGAPGSRIRINTPYDGIPAEQKELIIAHEIGHAIGLRHSNWWSGTGRPGPEGVNPDGANQITGTPYEDIPSIMIWEIYLTGRVWPGFSFYDQLAGFNLYPPAGPSVTISYPGGVPNLSWNYQVGVQAYDVVLNVEGENCYYSPFPTIRCERFFSSEIIGTTTGLAISDPVHPYTGIATCTTGPEGTWRTAMYVTYARYPIGQTFDASGAFVLPSYCA